MFVVFIPFLVSVVLRSTIRSISNACCTVTVHVFLSCHSALSSQPWRGILVASEQ